MTGDAVLLIAGEPYAPVRRAGGTWQARARGLPPGPLPVAVVAKGDAGRQRVVPATDTGITRIEVTLPTR